MGAPDSGTPDPHIERTRRSPEINQAGIGEAGPDDGLQMSKAPQTSVCGALAGEEGFEPSAYGFGDRRSTN